MFPLDLRGSRGNPWGDPPDPRGSRGTSIGDPRRDPGIQLGVGGRRRESFDGGLHGSKLAAHQSGRRFPRVVSQAIFATGDGHRLGFGLGGTGRSGLTKKQFPISSPVRIIGAIL